MADLAKLLVRLEGENIKLVKSLDQATRKIDRFEKNANKTVGRFRDSFKNAFAAIATYASVRTFSRFIKHSVDLADAANKAAQRLGIASSALQEYGLAAQFSGSSSEELQNGLRFLNRQISDAAAGVAKATDIFKTLNVAFTDTSGRVRKVDNVLKDIADRFSQAADDANKTNIAVQLFGRTGANLIPLLNAGAQGIDQMRQKARDLGLVMSDEAARAAEQFNDNLTVVRAQVRGLGNQITTGLLPTLNDLTGLMIDLGSNSSSAGQIIGQAFGGVLKGIAVIVLKVRAEITSLGNAIGGLAAAAALAAQGEFSRAKDIFAEMAADEAKLVKETEDQINNLFSGGFRKAGQDAASLAGVIKGSLGPIKEETAAAASSAKALEKQIASTIAALELQAATSGMSADAAKRYELQLKGASDAQLKHVESLQNQIAADKELQDSLDREAEAISKARDKWADLQVQLREVDSVALKYINDIEDLKTAHDLGVISTEQLNASLEKLGEQYVKATEKNKGWREQFEKSVERVGSGMQGALEDFFFAPAEKGFDGLFESFSNLLRRMAAEIAAQAVMQQLFKGLNNLGGGFAEIGGLLSGVTARAIGGPVTAGAPVLVGEKGPELFFPASSGSIATARQTEGMLGGGGVNVIVNTPNADSFRESRRQVASAIKRGLLG